MTQQSKRRATIFVALASAAAIALACVGCDSDSPDALTTRQVYVRDLVGQTLTTAETLLGKGEPDYSLGEDIFVLKVPPEAKPVESLPPMPPMDYPDEYTVVGACFIPPNPAPKTTPTSTTMPIPITSPSVTLPPPGPPQFPTDFPTPETHVYWDNAVMLAVLPTAGVTPEVIDKANQLGYQQGLLNQPQGKDCMSTDEPITAPVPAAAR